MKRLPLFILLFLASFFTNAQNADTLKLIGLHSAVGKTIDRDEKIKYNLFPQYHDNLFDSAQVFRYHDTAYLLRVSCKYETTETILAPAQMEALYDQVDEVVQASRPPPQYVLTPEEEKRQRQEARRQQWGQFGLQVLGEVVLITFEAIITAALTN